MHEVYIYGSGFYENRIIEFLITNAIICVGYFCLVEKDVIVMYN